MASPSDHTLRGKIADVITANAVNAVVYSWWALGHQQNDWPAMLRSDKTLDQSNNPAVHGYVIRRRRSEGERRGNCGARRTYNYLIYAFHYYYTGDEDQNTEKLFSDEIDALTAVFDNPQNLDTDLARIDPIAWTFDLQVVGGELMHLAIGTLNLEPCDT